mmetsp:Transcript_85935/g.277532  ORF Transcript_85935/g.277532 Transcript_85935/m.277532 type:complete len:233 (+) Transcript_85935:794-1492(+)
MELKLHSILARLPALRLHVAAELGVSEVEPVLVHELRDELHAPLVSARVLSHREVQLGSITTCLPTTRDHISPVLGILQVEVHAERCASLGTLAGRRSLPCAELREGREDRTTARQGAGTELANDPRGNLLPQHPALVHVHCARQHWQRQRLRPRGVNFEPRMPQTLGRAGPALGIGLQHLCAQRLGCGREVEESVHRLRERRLRGPTASRPRRALRGRRLGRRRRGSGGGG